MCRSYSTESQKKDWGKRLSLRGNPRSKEVYKINLMVLFFFFWLQIELISQKSSIIKTYQILRVIQKSKLISL